MRVRSIVEKPKQEDAPSNLAVIGRYVFTPEIFDALDRIEPGTGGELQLTDAIGLLNETQTGLRPRRSPKAATTSARRSTSSGRTWSSRSTVRTSVPSSSCSSSISCAEPRPRLDAAPGRYRRTVIPLEEVQAEVLRSVSVLAPVSTPLADALGLVLAEPVVADRAGAAVREHRDGRVRGARRRYRGRAPRPIRCGSRVVG